MQHSTLPLALFLAITFFLNPVFGADHPPQKCDVGPLHKTYGKTRWFVYSCNNDKVEGNAMAVFVTAPDNPAMPFVFFFHFKDGGYRLYGEGTGDKKITDAAFNDLQKLTESDIDALINQTKQVQVQGEKSSGK